jgi:hypothetical protein
MRPTFTIGEKVFFRESKTKPTQLSGVIQSIEKMHCHILTQDNTTYKVHINRVKKQQDPRLYPQPPGPSAGRIRKFAPKAPTPSKTTIQQTKAINQELNFCSFTNHAAERFQQRLNHYSPIELEQFLSEAVEAPWIRYDKTSTKAYYHAQSKTAFITDNSGTKIITVYRDFKAPSEEAKSTEVKQKVATSYLVNHLDEDLEDFTDARLYNQLKASARPKKSFKKHKKYNQED